MIYNHPDKFGNHRRCDHGDMFLICGVTACLKGYVSLWVEPLLHLAMFGGQ